MAKILLKKGVEGARLSYTPSIGEAIWTTDNHQLWIGDGSTAGGIEVTGDYFTKAESDARYVDVAGDTMTGLLTLSGAPTNNLHAATKQYVDSLVDSNMKSPDGFTTNAGGNYPTDYKGTGAVHEGDTFYVINTSNGTVVGSETVNIGDMLVALTDAPGDTDSNWTIVESNRDSATETVPGVIELATQAEVDAGADATRAITPATLALTTNLNQEAIEDIVGGMTNGVENGISVSYNDSTGNLDYNVNDPLITIDGAVTGSATMTNLGDVTITTTATSDPTLTLAGDASGSCTFTDLGDATLTVTVANNSHSHVHTNISDWDEAVEDTTGAMVSGNTENGISVTYDDSNGKLNFDVNDFDITLTGAATGSGTVTNLSNVSFATNVANLGLIDDVSYAAAPSNTDLLQFNGTNWVPVSVSSVGRTSFTALDDTPANYTGSGDEILFVNAAETDVEFRDTIDGGSF